MTISRLASPAAIFALGAGLQFWLWSRAWLYWDQILLLRLGMALTVDAQLAAFAKVMSGGGVIPGCLLQLLVAGPLAIWFDYRSPGLLVGLFHLAAGGVLWRLLGRITDRRFTAMFLALYWLSPWRLYHSAFLWEPNYLLLPAALHLWACWRLRPHGHEGAVAARQSLLAPSLILGAILALSPQLHASGVVLLLLTLLLGLQRLLRVHPGALVGGAVAGALPLLPALLAALQAPLPAMAQGSLGEIGFLRFFPLLRPVQYWLRISTPDLGRRLRQTVFYPDSGNGDATTAADGLLYLLQAASLALAVVTLVASIWYFRGIKQKRRSTAGGYLRRYGLLALLALVGAAGLSPQTLQGWHSLVVLHAACLPVAAWALRALDRRRRARGGWRSRLALASVALLLLLRLPQVLVVGLGHPMFRPPTDPVARARVAPENLPAIDLERIPFGSGKESEGPPGRFLPLR